MSSTTCDKRAKMMEDRAAMAARLRFIRNEIGIPFTHLAKECECSVESMKQYVQGRVLAPQPVSEKAEALYLRKLQGESLGGVYEKVDGWMKSLQCDSIEELAQVLDEPRLVRWYNNDISTHHREILALEQRISYLIRHVDRIFRSCIKSVAAHAAN